MKLADLNPAGWTTKAYVGAGLAVLAALILTLAYCQGKHAGANGEKVGQLERDNKTLHTVNAADNKAADERLHDQATTQQQAQELHDASTHPGDDRNTRRLRRLCVQLRQQSGHPSDNPACTRFDGEAGTSPAPSGAGK